MKKVRKAFGHKIKMDKDKKDNLIITRSVKRNQETIIVPLGHYVLRTGTPRQENTEFSVMHYEDFEKKWERMLDGE